MRSEARKIMIYSYRFLVSVLLFLLASFLILYILVQQPSVQSWLADKATTWLSEKTDTKVSVEGVEIKFFRMIRLNNVYIEDQKGDTLAYIRHLDSKLSYFNPFKSKFYFNTLSLDGVRANVYRTATDSTFNYFFLLDAFSSNKQPKKKKSSSNPVDVRINAVSLSDIRLVMDDQYGGQGHYISLNKLQVSLKEIDLPSKILRVKKLELTNPDYSLILYKPKEEKTTTDTFSVNIGWRMSADILQIEDGHFALNTKYIKISPSQKRFDPQHMDIKGIQLQAVDFGWDSIMSVDIENLQAFSEKDKIEVKQLSAKAAMCDQYISADGLKLKYNNSVLRADAGIYFDSFGDFGDFLNKVDIKANIAELTTKGSDVAVWYKDAGKYVPDVSLSGSFKGTVSDIKTEKLIVQVGKQTVLSANASVKGLPDIDKMMVNAEIKQLSSRSEDLKRILPFVKLPKEVDQLGAFKLNGIFKGKMGDFNARLDLNGAPGAVFADVRMQMGKKKVPVYAGVIRSSGLNLQSVTGQDFLGNIAFDLKVDGKGFNLDQLDTKVEGFISDVDLNYYRYERIDIAGYFQKRMFKGNVDLTDECALLRFDGLLDLNDPNYPRYLFSASIKDADLQRLNLLPEKLIVNIDGDFEFNGKDLNDLTGVADLKNISLQNNEVNIEMADIQICLEKLDDYKQYTINSPDVNGFMRGYFDPLALPVAMQYYFSQHTNLLDAPGFEKLEELMITQDIEMNINISKDFGLVSLFAPQIKGFSDVRVAGSFNNEQNKINLDVSFDSINFNGVKFDEFNARLYDRNDSVIISSHLDQVQVGNLIVKNINVDATSNLTGLYADVKVEDDSARNHLRLVTAAQFNNDSVLIRFPESKLRVNYKDWTIDNRNSILLVDSLFQLKNFTLKNQDQEISITNRQNLADASVMIKDLNLSDLAQIVDSTGLISRGFLSGQIHVQNALSNPEADGFVRINDLIVYGLPVDLIGLDAKISDKEKSLLIGGFIEDDQFDVQLNGKYSLDPKVKSPIDVDVQFDKLDLGFLAFPIILGNQISDLKASAKGTVKVGGSIQKIALDGKATIMDTAQVKVNFLGTRLRFVNEDVVLKPKSIEFYKGGLLDKNITILDDFGNRATLQAKLDHEYFKDFAVSAKIISERFNFLNTTYKDNNVFFGKVFASGAVDISGPVNNINMVINAISLPGTDFNVVAGGAEGGQKVDFVNFVDRSQKGTEQNSASSGPKKSSNISLEMNITATPDAEVKLYLDYAANDVIKARGNADLNMRLSGDAMTMNGKYEVTSGEYMFSQQDVINKKFQIRNGSTITLDGDMMNTQMAVEAVYSAKPSMSSIVDSSSALSNRRFPVDVVLKIGGTLEKTDIDFKMEPSKGQLNVPDELVAVLDKINNSENDRRTQAFGLIVFNTFINMQNGGDLGFSSLGISTLTEFINAKVSQYFNEALEMLLPGTEVTINQGVDNTGLRITRKLSNERLIINLGGDVQYGRAMQILQNNTGFIGDVELEYLVTEDGRVRIRAYSKYDNTIIRLENESYFRTGVGITYQKDFNRFNQLFIRENRGKRKKSLPVKNDATEDNPVSDTLPPNALRPAEDVSE